MGIGNPSIVLGVPLTPNPCLELSTRPTGPGKLVTPGLNAHHSGRFWTTSNSIRLHWHYIGL
jgi:hypothetical protein